MLRTQSDRFRAIVGTMILASAALAAFVSPKWLFFTAFIGVNMLQSAFTHFCPMDMLLAKGNKPS
jgi:hypothetical protein